VTPGEKRKKARPSRGASHLTWGGRGGGCGWWSLRGCLFCGGQAGKLDGERQIRFEEKKKRGRKKNAKPGVEKGNRRRGLKVYVKGGKREKRKIRAKGKNQRGDVGDPYQKKG